ncbi:MAG: hypothetical protein OXK82_09810 [Deltaproteobacteria bacterium]|nr:hypothetical protein [Deltaproteobacteria bacterium]
MRGQGLAGVEAAAMEVAPEDLLPFRLLKKIVRDVALRQSG